MKTLKNGIELMLITLQQFSTNNDILTFEFKKPLGFELQGSLVEIIYELDKLDNIKNNNINITETEETIVVTWLVKESITLTKGDKKVQIVIKNNDRVYLSSVFIIKVLESLNVDNKIVESNLSYLEFWEERIKQLAKKVEEFESIDLEQFVTDEELENKLDKNIYEKDKINFASKEDTYNKEQIDEKISKITSIDVSNFATKEELNTKADKNSTYTRQEVDEKVLSASTPNIIAGNGISIKNTTISARVDNKTISFDKQGNLQANVSVGGGEDGNISLTQVVIDDVRSGTKYEIFNENINQKRLVQVFKIENSRTERETITDFKIVDDSIIANNGIRLKNNFVLNVTDGESETINKSQFLEILKMQGSV